MTSVTPGSSVMARISGPESLAAARTSTSPIVSLNRRSEPACSHRSQPGTALRAERRDPRHLPDAVGHADAQVLELGDRAGLLVLDDLGRDRAADAGDLAQRGVVQQVDIAAVTGDGLGGLLVVASAKGVAT